MTRSRARLFRALLSAGAVLLAAVTLGAGPTIKELRVQPQRVAAYQRVEATFLLDRSYDNPYDPEQIDCWLELQGPGNRRLRVPGFWLEPRQPAGDFTARHIFTGPSAEEYQSAGPGHWVVRFVLTVPGQWQGRVRARDAHGETLSPEFVVVCQPGRAHGFVRPAPNGQFLCFDDGTGFVPRGLCLAWARGRGERDTYDYYFQRLQQADCNTVRVWLCHWAWLEWTKGKAGALKSYEGVGRYNQDIAYNFDRLIELAEKRGLYVQLCLNNACWEFGRPDGKHDAYDSWGGNPYNRRNGGPCARPSDFWTNPQARRLYRNKLRYIVARWGYSTHVLAWELWNEQGSQTDASVAWHREMADYLRATDPYRHMVTTSTWLSDARELSRIFAAMDLVQLHYASDRFVRLARRAFAGKPLIVGEGPWAPTAMARIAYTAPLSGAAGPPLTWHSGPDSPIERQDLYRVLAAAARFCRDFPAAASQVSPLRVVNLSVSAPAGHEYAPVLVRPGFNTWLKKATRSEFIVAPDGQVDTSGMSNRLYGSNADRAPYRNPPTFVVNYPAPGLFAVHVGESSGPAVLMVTVDGQEKLGYT
ncbi:MAG: DUF5060 domain-containing protein, partial [Armatimonadetes bacterium]|nr:DUF5060 domain-containing protein [Armatimonadota bacterium]